MVDEDCNPSPIRPIKIWPKNTYSIESVEPANDFSPIVKWGEKGEIKGGYLYQEGKRHARVTMHNKETGAYSGVVLNDDPNSHETIHVFFIAAERLTEYAK